MRIEYFEYPEMPGKPYFACVSMRATLSKESCSQRWRKANLEGDADCSSCKGCQIGAEHAGVRDANRWELAGTHICARCHRPSLRMVRHSICVSCANREYELRKGRNAKGSRPTKIAPLHRRLVRFSTGGQVHRLVQDSTDLSELLICAMRDAKQHTEIGFSAPFGAVFRQGRLF